MNRDLQQRLVRPVQPDDERRSETRASVVLDWMIGAIIGALLMGAAILFS